MKTLIASGCSFTFEPWNWPTFVANKFNLELRNVGMASQGNGLIARKLIYEVNKALDLYNPDEILVGVMWSGTDRHEFYKEESIDSKSWGNYPKDYNDVKNPTNVVDGKLNWYILNHHWTNKESTTYYKNFHTVVQGMVLSLEHILRVQLFLEKMGIKYFMSSYLDIFSDASLMNNDEISYLYKNINLNSFLPVKGCHEWVKENYSNNGGFNEPDEKGYIGIHPTEFGHKKFTDEVIIPHLNKIYHE